MLALRNRDFRLLWTGQLLSGLGSWLLLVAVPYKVFELTGSAVATGFSFVAESVPALVIGPVAGLAADRWDRRRTMLAVSLGQAGCILPIALARRPSQLAVVYAGLLAESALGQFYQPAAQALVPSLLGRSGDLTSANALIAGGSAVTRLVGASLGGVIFAALGLTAVVVIDAGSYLVAAACLALLRWRAAPRRTMSRHAAAGSGLRLADWPAMAGLGRGIRHLAASCPLRSLLLAAAMFQLGNGIFTASLVPYIRLRLHGSAGDAGFLIAATGAGYLIGAPVSRALFHRVGLRLLASMSLLIAAAAFVGWFAASSLGGALPLAAVTGMSAMVFLVTQRTWLQRLTPGSLLGRASSAFIAVEAAAGLAGVAVGGILIGLAGLTASAAAAGLAIAAGAAMTALRRCQNPEAVVDEQPGRPSVPRTSI